VKTTHLIIAINVAVFLLMLKVGGMDEAQGFSTRTLLLFGADYVPLVRNDLQLHRLIASTFIHLNVMHLLMNMVSLHQVGTALEAHYGRWRFLALYFVAGIGGSLGSLAYYWRHPVVSAGASGAICGLIGAAAVMGHYAGERGVAFRNAMLRWAAIVFVFGFFIQADNAAHAGGLVVGAAIGWLMRKTPLARAQRAERMPWGESLACLAVAALGFVPAAHFRDRSYTAADLVNRGVALAKDGKDAEAAAAYRQALVLDPEDDIALYDLGLALRRTGDLAGSEKALRAAIALKPGRSRYLALAHTLGDQHRDDEAAEAIAAANELPRDEGEPP
jgi:rhomboid protease GluP